MKTKTFKKVGLTIKYSDGEMIYDDAVWKAPEGWRLIKPFEAVKIMEEYKGALPFWFWCLNPKWNKEGWRPVAQGINGISFYLDAYDDLWASRGVYVKEVRG